MSPSKRPNPPSSEPTPGQPAPNPEGRAAGGRPIPQWVSVEETGVAAQIGQPGGPAAGNPTQKATIMATATAPPIKMMGRYTAVGMRTKIEDPTALIINTCSKNGSYERGTEVSWAWANPTNTATHHHYHDIIAISTECLWQGTKILPDQTEPDLEILAGKWKKNKGKKPLGAYAGPGQPLITNPGEARRAIYIPAYKRQIDHWFNSDDEVLAWVEQTDKHEGRIYLRDHDTGRGLDRQGPMSHAWVLATYLNKGVWPD